MTRDNITTIIMFTYGVVLGTTGFIQDNDTLMILANIWLVGSVIYSK